MSNKEKILLITCFASWIALFACIFVIEVLDVLVSDIIALLVLSALAAAISIGLFIYDYYKNKDNIAADRKKKFLSLKQNKPLRYCPSDDELLAKYKSGVIKDKDLEILKVEPSKIVRWQELTLLKQEKEEQQKILSAQQKQAAAEPEEMTM